VIALVVIAIFLIYVILLIVAIVRPKTRKRKIIWCLVVLSPLIWKTWDMPIGYVQYRVLCAREGGLQIIEHDLMPAKVVRVDANRFSSSFVTEILQRNPQIESVEAGHPERYMHNLYARYYIQKYSNDISITKDIDLKIEASDEEVGYPWEKNYRMRPMKSKADYVILEERKLYPFRTTINRLILSRSDGKKVAMASQIHFSWTLDRNTLFGRAFISNYPTTENSIDDLVRMLALIGVSYR
jgi:hypothetical protein